jgi:hypothetical protein
MITPALVAGAIVLNSRRARCHLYQRERYPRGAEIAVVHTMPFKPCPWSIAPIAARNTDLIMSAPIVATTLAKRSLKSSVRRLKTEPVFSGT